MSEVYETIIECSLAAHPHLPMGVTIGQNSLENVPAIPIGVCPKHSLEKH